MLLASLLSQHMPEPPDAMPQVAIQLPEGFTPTCMAHPDTYLNKVVVGSQEGKLQLWNFATGKMLYEFTGLGDAAMQCIAPSPALDVVGLGMSDGCVVLFDSLNEAPTLMTPMAACKKQDCVVLHTHRIVACCMMLHAA